MYCVVFSYTIPLLALDLRMHISLLEKRVRRRRSWLMDVRWSNCADKETRRGLWEIELTRHWANIIIHFYTSAWYWTFKFLSPIPVKPWQTKSFFRFLTSECLNVCLFSQILCWPIYTQMREKNCWRESRQIVSLFFYNYGDIILTLNI